jgi:hypothetical protein
MLDEWMENLPDEFVKLAPSEVYDGRLSQQTREKIASAAAAAF